MADDERPVSISFRFVLISILVLGFPALALLAWGAASNAEEAARIAERHEAESIKRDGVQTNAHIAILDAVDRLAYAQVAPEDEKLALRRALAKRPAVAKLLQDIEVEQRENELARRKSQVRQRNGLSTWPSGRVELPPAPPAAKPPAHRHEAP